MSLRDDLAKLRWFDVDREFLCRCGRPECDAPIRPHRTLGLYLDRAREMYGQPITVTSGNRCAWYNAQPNVGGEDPSEHVWPEGCLGADLACATSRERARLLDALRLAGFTRVGIYPKHVHVGVGAIVAVETFPDMVTWLGGYKAPA